jgi:hypothetical protein
MYIIEIYKNNRTFFLHEDRINLTWMKKFALIFDSIESAEETIKNDYNISNICHSGLTKIYKIVNYNEAKNH